MLSGDFALFNNDPICAMINFELLDGKKSMYADRLLIDSIISNKSEDFSSSKYNLCIHHKNIAKYIVTAHSNVDNHSCCDIVD